MSPFEWEAKAQMIHIKGCEGGWDELVHLIVKQRKIPPHNQQEKDKDRDSQGHCQFY